MQTEPISAAEGLTPLFRRVVVRPDPTPDEVKSSGGIILTTPSEAKREAAKQQYGTIVALGPIAFEDDPASREAIKPGTRVVFARYGGIYLETPGGEIFRVLNDLDIIMHISTESTNG